MIKMIEETSSLIGLELFTPWGVKVGDVTNIEIDSDKGEVSNIYMEETNENLVEYGDSIMIPFRWIQAVGDIIILKHFPEDLPIKSEQMGDEEYNY